MKVDSNSIFFAAAGLYYFLIFAISGFQVLYVPILGALFLAAAVGLYLKKRQGFILAVLVLPVGFVFGVAAFLSSTMMLGALSQSAYTLLNGSIILYLLASIFFGYRLIKERKKYGQSKETESAK